MSILKRSVKGKYTAASLIPELTDKEGDFLKNIEALDEGSKITIAGHSFGSTVSLLMGAYIANNYPDKKFDITIQNYAQLVCYDEEFCECITNIQDKLKIYKW